MATIKHQRNTVRILEIGISRNTKCVIWNGFPKSSHILRYNFVTSRVRTMIRNYLAIFSK